MIFRRTISLILAILPTVFFKSSVMAQSPGHPHLISEKMASGYFPLVSKTGSSPAWISENEWPGVRLAVGSFLKDIQDVTGKTAILAESPKSKTVVIVGTLGKNELIDKMVKSGKLNVKGINGKWESYVIQAIKRPLQGVDQALVIAGSDKRGTIFGVYDLSAQIGVSPWYWWADVPPARKKTIYVNPARHTDGSPAVKYRGIFINDEAPAFSGWAREKFGGINHLVYEKMFELILRLKGNYLWPAMWGSAFNDDDKQNPVLADEYGVVMGTSHHEPMDRAQQEWKKYGTGEWNYENNQEELQSFWRKGIENMGTKETVVTIGMRGDGDKPMTEGSNIALLENIVKDQRNIISDVLKKSPESVPQMWALYKEVQDYYDKGMRVPDDVTLLLCDDNWGNIRKLPLLTSRPRKGGYGIYYHFDYVGGPRNYKWLNTNTISKTWEQMHLAYAYNARQIWVVNAGDLKPMEYPISFFLDYAWNPNKWSASNLDQYAKEWAGQQFGVKNASKIADMLTRYTRYNARCKPELLNQNTYSLSNYNEFGRVVSDYNSLLAEAEQLNTTIGSEYKDAYFELVLHPIQACANLNEMYFEAAKNKFFAQSGNAAEADRAAANVKRLFNHDQEISDFYNNKLADGKWHHMMDQTHIGYVSWFDPKNNTIPELFKASSVGQAPDSLHKSPQLMPQQNSQANSALKRGFIAMEALYYTRAVSSGEVNWLVIPNYGNTLSGITPWPVTTPRVTPAGASPHLEYDVNLVDSGKVAITCFISPTLDFKNGDGLYYAVSIDNEQPQRVNITPKVDSRDWALAVSDNIRRLTTTHHIDHPGKHTVKYWMIDPAVVLEKVVLNTGGLKPSYLGPPDSNSRTDR